jgi:ABC-2 type transport system ATP-binding protein
MLGLAEANSGRAEVLGLGSDRKGLQIRQRVGYVPERPTLYEWMTVEEIGWFTAGFYGPGFLPEYARLVAQFGLAPKKKLSQLSKGTRAKVVLSLALAHQPELLILDAQGQTVFLSSHQIGEVERVADIVAILRKGKLALVEPLDKLKADVRQLTVTLREGITSPPALFDKILSQRSKPRQWQALVRGATDQRLAELRSHESVEGVEVHAPSLEDIFVATMQNEEVLQP